MSVRSSAKTFGLPTRLRDRQRQYVRNPARCQRMMVSGLTIATTSRTDGNQRQSQTNRKRSVLLRCGRFGVRRRSTLTCCRRTRFSASSVALALKREARIPRISLNRSVIRMRAYAVRLLRLRRIEFSVHTAAVSAFAKKGAHGTTIAEIAASLDMPTATVHYYFKNKDALYDAVLQQIVHLWFSKIASIEDGVDALAEIEKYVRSKMEFSRSYPDASRIFATDILGGHANILK